MKLYVRMENRSGEKHQVVVSCTKKSEGLVKAVQLMPKDFTRGKQLKPRIYVSEVGFDSENFEWIDVIKVLRKADYQVDE